jgi:hypothetical protein
LLSFVFVEEDHDLHGRAHGERMSLPRIEPEDLPSWCGAV